MSTESKRTDYGMTDKGAVTVIEKRSFDDSGTKVVTTFEVRHGVRTVADGLSRTKAETIAKAIAG